MNQFEFLINNPKMFKFMKKLFYAIFAIALLIATNHVFAQDNNAAEHNLTVTVPEVALVDIEGDPTINVSPSAPTEAGDPLDFTNTDNSLWINYSSIVPGSAAKKRSITVSLNELVPGIDINLTVGDYEGTGRGNKGTPKAGTLTLGTTAQDVITGIGSTHTENGRNSGHELTYGIGIKTDDYGQIFAKTHSVIVTYTITAAN
ncbi:MAG: hypothetical protein PHD61_05840 [Bacteroidales bacterium]|nr:hypothetical protein [Bacteroidales bacterium]